MIITLAPLVVGSCLRPRSRGWSEHAPLLQGLQDEEEQVGERDAAAALTAAGRRRNLEFEPLSTTALILEDRPA